MDLDDLEHNTRDGVHIASLAGTWIAAVVRLRRNARPRRPPELRAAAARRAHPVDVPPQLPWPATAGGGGAGTRDLLAARRPAARDRSLRPSNAGHTSEADSPPDPRAQPTRASDSTAGTGPSPSQSLTSADRRSRPTGSPARTNQTPLARDHTARRLRRQAIHRRRHGGSRLSRQASPAGARLRSPNFDHHAGRGVAHGHADAGLRLASV